MTSPLNRVAIAIGAFATAESMLTGDHQFHWKFQHLRKQQGPGSSAINNLTEENLSTAVNQSLKVATEFARLGTSMYSYWHFISGAGITSVAISASLMLTSWVLSLALTCFLYHRGNNGKERTRLRFLTLWNPRDIPNYLPKYLKTRKRVIDQAHHFGYVACYAVTGSFGVAGILTGLLLAKEAAHSLNWRQENFYPALWATYTLMKAQVDIMRSLKSTPALYALVKADAARDARCLFPKPKVHGRPKKRRPSRNRVSPEVLYIKYSNADVF